MMSNPWSMLFWLDVALLIYIYAGYPLLLALVCVFRKTAGEAPGGTDDLPSVTIIISACDEEDNIARKLDNCLGLNYPGDRLRIIVVSDGSADRTVLIVRGYEARGVCLVELARHQGKATAQNIAMRQASGDIILFTDADVILAEDALRWMVGHFHHRGIGCVVGRVVSACPEATGISEGEMFYWRYEAFIREKESQAGNLVAGSGAIIALRRELFETMDPDVSEDFILPINLAIKGYRTVYEPKAVGVEQSYPLSPGDKLRGRVRTVGLDTRSLWLGRALLNPFRHPLHAWGLATHKAWRWLVPYLLAILFGLNLLMMKEQPYRYTLAAQSVFYGLALLGYFWNKVRKPPLLLSLPMAFCVINLAAMIGVAHFVAGRKAGSWRPMRGVKAWGGPPLPRVSTPVPGGRDSTKKAVTAVIPSYNEERWIGPCLDSVLKQDYAALMEILVVDGLSEDRTADIIREYAARDARVRLITNAPRTVPHALNIGVREGKGDIFIRMDAHAVYASDYVKRCVEVLQRHGVDNAGGPMRAEGLGPWGEAIAAAHHSLFGLGGGRFHDPRAAGEADTVYLGAFPRATFEKFGLFDVRLARNQDIEFNSRIRKLGGKVRLDPSIRSIYFCRGALRDFWQQNLANGRWVVYTAAIAPHALSWRHAVPFVFLSLLAGGGLLAAGGGLAGHGALRAAGLAVFLPAALSYLTATLLASAAVAGRRGIKFLAFMPPVFAVLHLSYGAGSIWGLMTLMGWLRRRAQDGGVKGLQPAGKKG